MTRQRARPISTGVAELARLAEGKIIAVGWQYHDDPGLLRQLTELPACCNLPAD
jgi:hypothetical protein